MDQTDNVDPGGHNVSVAPRTDVEQLVADVWASALGRVDIGVTEDFFELGGQSLHVTRVINGLQQLTGLDVDVRVFFETPTIAGLADHVVELFTVSQASGAGPSLPAPTTLRGVGDRDGGAR